MRSGRAVTGEKVRVGGNTHSTCLCDKCLKKAYKINKIIKHWLKLFDHLRRWTVIYHIHNVVCRKSFLVKVSLIDTSQILLALRSIWCLEEPLLCTQFSPWEIQRITRDRFLHVHVCTCTHTHKRAYTHTCTHACPHAHIIGYLLSKLERKISNRLLIYYFISQHIQTIQTDFV